MVLPGHPCGVTNPGNLESDGSMNNILINQQQAIMDQAWKTLEDQYITLQQVQGCMEQTGLIAGYLAILVGQVRLNKLKRLADES